MRRQVLWVAGWACAMSACGPSGSGSIAFTSVSPAQPKISDVVTVTFTAIDDRGQPAAGTGIHFSLVSPFADGGVPGVTLSPTDVNTNKSDGTAQTQLVATNRVSSVIVRAQSGNLTAYSPPISFAGAVPSARNFTFACGPIAGTGSGGVHALGAYDDTRTLISGVQLGCTAHVADRNGEALSGVEVSFLAEAGTIDPTQTTDDHGNATVLFHTSYPLPADQTPGTFTFKPWLPTDPTHIGDSANPVDYIAPLWMHPYEWVPNPIAQYASSFTGPFDPRQEPQRPDPVSGLTFNPRDNLVTLIAVTTGEEAFDDANNNGHWDTGEAYLDSTEPFVDSNDNGTRDPGELYIDTNGNGQWDAKNQHFDASTLIWAKERILWTGIPSAEDLTTAVQPVTAVAGGLGLIVTHCGAVGPVTVLASDPWYNRMAQNGNGDGCSLGGASVTGTGTGGFQPLVQAFPTTFSTGVGVTYPAVDSLTFEVADGHDCSLVPPPAPWSPPQTFNVPVVCNLTGSPISGAQFQVILPGASGVVY